MKILILQLARFGDIYTSWPAVNALKREYPDCEIHMLVRARFKDACTGLRSISKVHVLQTAEVLEPLYNSADDISTSLGILERFVFELRSEGYSKVINLSFSPFSSYLSSLLRTEDNSIIGYQRYSDGNFALTDIWSSYFYAQVGIGRSNRLHLSEIFAQILGVSLKDQDWKVVLGDQISVQIPESKYIVVHLGASQDMKSYPVAKWCYVIDKILEEWSGSVVLIGSENEKSLSQQIQQRPNSRIIDYVGKTKIEDLFRVISNSDLLIGADSSPIHIASLVDCVTLNLSGSNVNLWETGPKAPGSRVLYSGAVSDIEPEVVASESMSILLGGRPLSAHYYINTNRECLELREKSQVFEWSLIKFLYFSERAPISNDLNFASALVHMYDVTQLAIEQLYNLQRNPNDKVAQTVLQRTDEIIQNIGDLVPQIKILIRWFQSEKVQIAPNGFRVILEKTFSCYKNLSEALTQLQMSVNLLSHHGESNGTNELERS